MVGTDIRTKNYEASGDYTGTDGTVAKFDTKSRTGVGQSLWMNGYSGNQASIGTLFYVPEHYDVTQWWFYDDGEGSNKGFFQLMSGTSALRLNLWIYPAYNNNFFASDGDNNNQFSEDSGYPVTPARTKGWHQFAVVRQGNRVTCYLDGVSVNQGIVEDGIIGNTTSIHYQRWGKESNANSVWVDEFAAVDLDVPYYDVTVNVGENGTVKYGDAVVENGGKISVEEGSDLTLSILPDNGYKAKVTVDDQEVTVQDNNTVTLSNITADRAVAVVFEKVITAPEISGSSANYIIEQEDYLYNNEKHFAYVSYYKAAVPANYTIKGLGMNFGDGTNTVSLPVINWTSDYLFGIRVFGDAVKKENTYTFQGFAIVEDGEGNESTITTGEPITK